MNEIATMGRNELIERIYELQREVYIKEVDAEVMEERGNKIVELETKIKNFCETQCPVRVARNWNQEICKRNCCLYKNV